MGQQDILDTCPTLRKICPSQSHRPTIGDNLTFLPNYPSITTIQVDRPFTDTDGTETFYF